MNISADHPDPAAALGEVVRFERRDYTDDVVQSLVAEVQEEYIRRYGGPDAARLDPAEFRPPFGAFFVGFVGKAPLVTGGWRLLAPGIAELKRMYVPQRARRRGLARAMLAQLERTAGAAGLHRLVLNTGTAQPEAVRLYESAGYATIPGFGIYADAPLALFYGKDLAG